MEMGSPLWGCDQPVFAAPALPPLLKKIPKGEASLGREGEVVLEAQKVGYERSGLALVASQRGAEGRHEARQNRLRHQGASGPLLEEAAVEIHGKQEAEDATSGVAAVGQDSVELLCFRSSACQVLTNFLHFVIDTANLLFDIILNRQARQIP